MTGVTAIGGGVHGEEHIPGIIPTATVPRVRPSSLAVNFLAHSALAFDDPSLLVGQFAGDFVRGRDLSGFPPRVATGIRLHRSIDAFTDAHPALRVARRGFEPTLRRHAGIVVDVVFDHLLARHWPAPAGRDLPGHARWVDESLAVHRTVLPPALARFATFVRGERLLEGNVEPRSIGRTLERLSRRSPRMAPLALAATRGTPLVSSLSEPFAAFWPELVRMADTRYAELLLLESPEASSGRSGAER